MAKRPVFIPQGEAPFARAIETEFSWNGGFAPSQKQKNIRALDGAFLAAHPDARVLEISSKSMQENGPANPQEPTPQEIQRLNAIQQHFGQERQKRAEYRAQALAQKEQTEKLKIGSEIVQGTLERQVEVKVGDDMRELMNVEVLVEDDKIIAIRG